MRPFVEQRAADEIVNVLDVAGVGAVVFDNRRKVFVAAALTWHDAHVIGPGVQKYQHHQRVTVEETREVVLFQVSVEV
ncbi:hypothetical protein GC584_09770 [Corynebacterium sp. zg912]|uniref:Uncharacterized protein n=1 Tax=Corynebacterium wankanglinii TaxID=2735136 RepID=A0A7H0K860_9CORY|nr:MULTISPECIES: hypothetical protein [Corynebacterium]MBA1838200.1 hypothetical protein [Corynebacterium wankanglinii]MCR5929684.1 hypothetical protein [Corynebacterium sp. zg912]QNP93476.1 hypothetical protein IA203_06115 [Corynebacterium wankanglinii]